MKYALITGGSRGIGRSVSIKLAAMGYTVLINYQSNDKEAANTLQLVREKGGDGELLKFDVTDSKAVSEALNNWSEQHPDEYIEVLINNAGIRKDNLMLWMTEAEWSGVLNTSLNGFFYVTQALLKNMLIKRFGRIVNIVSLSGLMKRLLSLSIPMASDVRFKAITSISENLGTTPGRGIFPFSFMRLSPNCLQILRILLNIVYKLCIY